MPIFLSTYVAVHEFLKAYYVCMYVYVFTAVHIYITQIYLSQTQCQTIPADIVVCPVDASNSYFLMQRMWTFRLLLTTFPLNTLVMLRVSFWCKTIYSFNRMLLNIWLKFTTHVKTSLKIVLTRRRGFDLCILVIKLVWTS